MMEGEPLDPKPCARVQTPSRELAEEHYKDLSSKPFFPSLVDYIISGPVVCMVCGSLIKNPTALLRDSSVL